MPPSLPRGFLTPSSAFLINSKTYKLDRMRILSRFKPPKLLAPLASGEYPVHCVGENPYLALAVATTVDSLPPTIRLHSSMQ